MSIGDVLQGISMFILAWIGTELRSLREKTGDTSERVARLEGKLQARERGAVASDPFLLLCAIGLGLWVSGCAPLGAAAAGAVSGAAIGGPTGALAGGVGGLLGAFISEIVHGFRSAATWLGGGDVPHPPPSTFLGTALGWLAIGLGLWLIVHVVGPAGIGRMWGATVRGGKRLRALCRLG